MTAPVPNPGMFARVAPAQPVELTPPADGMSGHPAVDAAIRSMTNAAELSPTDQIAEYEAAYRTLRETLATIDQA
ncbi:hypothetical protein Ais01nite_81480 [Asanoa ishikariensis]|uniref:Uncharacterized protein n=1 Tax=Asanoa ishikariensis TaxID=137265 RepID=A0A1H3V0G8_9ACTN|nr:hypothetical protein [Asanoa ishikariensis]GIF70113.1 hypothetical protein Ais01nite_81480 [Asanoa ishikariensis]SDZ67589.1 hypothetical protein SAMN05421684_8490 [Asanoa ishikariensis]